MQKYLKLLLEAAEDVEKNPAALPDAPEMDKMPTQPADQPINSPPADPGMADPSMGTDPGMATDPSMGDPSMMGAEPVLSPIQIGRAYELKKIHLRLTRLESYLSDVSDLELLKLREVVAEALDLFDIVISNFDSYKDKINDIIILFYKFTQESYGIFKDYLKKKSHDINKDNKMNSLKDPSSNHLTTK